jgi:hypothetical protein
MADGDAPRDPVDAARGFLSRWSRRKIEHQSAGDAPPAVTDAEPVPASTQEGRTAAEPPSPAEVMASLPPVESLTPESDFSAFMNPVVDPALRRTALKKLFTDPHFNVMDGLDTYIDDYSIEDPIPEALMNKLYQARQHVFSDEQNEVLRAQDEAEAAQLASAQAPVSADAPVPLPEADIAPFAQQDEAQPGTEAGASVTEVTEVTPGTPGTPA